MDIVYEYKEINETLIQIKNKIDGLHNIEIKLKTPFEKLEEGEITIVTQIENKVIQTTAKVVTKNTKLSIIGNFEVKAKSLSTYYRRNYCIGLLDSLNNKLFTVIIFSTRKITSI